MKKMYLNHSISNQVYTALKTLAAVWIVALMAVSANAQIIGGPGSFLLDDRDGDGILNAIDIAPDDPCEPAGDIINPVTCCTHRGTTIDFRSSGGTQDDDHTTVYVLTNADAQIEATATDTFFDNTSLGLHYVYAINYDVNAGITGLEVGNNMTDINADCATISAPLIVHNCSELPTIDNFNSAPTATINYAEGSGAVIVDVDATDPEGETENGGGLTYSLSGIDAAFFSIDPSGALTFTAEPNFELPLDFGLDNTYEVTVTVTDSEGGEDTMVLSVVVDDSCESSAVTLSYD
ncbi:MAG: cadherin repeat domain-containing protein [Bacteroidota bacterium]